MGKQRFEQLASLFEQARELESEARQRFLEENCDAEMREQVEALLRHHDSGGLLDNPIQPADAPQEEMPASIGQFRILEMIGRGGMGVVYRAEQDQPKRQVAIKMIHMGLHSRELRRRFEFETSILARLQHPGIAQIYEVGTTEPHEGGRPFFAMELIKGVALDQFIKNTDPPVDARLRLFLAICDAVQHAHQNGVIHRDLKPANILVTGEGAPKILDFGVARATDADLNATLYTTPGQLVGTLAYMSPEQVDTAVEQLDTRSDVYALGIILYEILAERLPYDVEGKPLSQAIRLISEATHVSLANISRHYKGDLTTIVNKALEKEPARRYASVADLAADMRRYLNDEPITARPATTLYQLKKFARRNKGLVAGISAAFVVLLAGVFVSTSLAIERSRALDEANHQRKIAEDNALARSKALDEANRQRKIAEDNALARSKALEEANRQRDTAQAVKEFLDRDVLAKANPSNEPNRNITLREVVDRAAERVAGKFKDQPFVEAEIRTTLCNTYKGLGEYKEASIHARAALKRLQEITTEPTYELLLTMNRVASLEKLQGNMDEAEKVFRETLRISDEAFGPDDEATMSLTNNLALLLVGKREYDEAASLFEPLLERRMRLLGEEHRHTMITMNNLALLYVNMERYDDAESMHRRELELSKRVMGPEHPDTLISMANMATLLMAKGNDAEAEQLIRKVIDIGARVLGADHPRTLVDKSGLVEILTRRKKFAEAEKLVEEILPVMLDKLGEEHPNLDRLIGRQAALLFDSGRLDEAEIVATELYQRIKKRNGKDDAGCGQMLRLLGSIARKEKRFEESRQLGIRAYEILKKAYGAAHSKTRHAAEQLAQLFDEQDEDAQRDRWRALAAKPKAQAN